MMFPLCGNTFSDSFCSKVLKYKYSIDRIEEDIRRELRTTRVGDVELRAISEKRRKNFIFIKLNDMWCIPPLMWFSCVINVICVQGKVWGLLVRA